MGGTVHDSPGVVVSVGEAYSPLRLTKTKQTKGRQSMKHVVTLFRGNSVHKRAREYTFRHGSDAQDIER